MNFRDLPEKEKQEVAKLMFQPLSSAQELKDWAMFYLGLDMPFGHVDPDSTSSPVEAMWEIYETVKLNKGNEKRGFIMLSARAGFKTLSASILETILMLHFKLTIAHMAAIREQSHQSVSYINYFFTKIEPLLTAVGWENASQNKNQIEYKSSDGESVYIKVVVCSPAGANSSHTNLFFVDEIDVIRDTLAYEEAKRIPTYAKGIHPITIKLSTRKYAFGMMAKEVENAPISGDKILRWNVMDIAERCPPSRHRPELPTEDMYVQKSLPLKQLSTQEYNELPDIEKPKYELVPNAYYGCKTCPLLSVCRTRLAHRKETDHGGLYRPIDAVIGEFKTTPPDMAEAQLMCWRPSSKGLVYPRFETGLNKGNVITLEKAYETLIGEHKRKVSELDLLLMMQNLKIRFFAGIDWGYTHDFVIVIFAMLPNGEVWVVDCYSSPGLEFSDQLEIAKKYRDKYRPDKWFADQAMPSHIKSFNKNAMKSPGFTKDVMGGIEALRSKVVDGSGRRLLKVWHTEANKKVVQAFVKHHFKLDSTGNPTTTPDDTPGIADCADALRYVAQNMFPVRGPFKPQLVTTEEQKQQSTNPTAEQQMKEEVAKRIVEGGGEFEGGSGGRGGIRWSF